MVWMVRMVLVVRRVLGLVLLMRVRMMTAAAGCRRNIRSGSGGRIVAGGTALRQRRRRLSEAVLADAAGNASAAAGSQLSSTSRADAGRRRDGQAIHWFRFDARHYRSILSERKVHI